MVSADHAVLQARSMWAAECGKNSRIPIGGTKRNGLARKLVQKKEKTSTKSLSAAEISGGKAAALLWGFENLSP